MPNALSPREILHRKRDGLRLDAAQIAAAVAGLSGGDWSDSQVGAFAMAVCLRGMDAEETLALTRAMRDSGQVLDWSDLPGPVLDKHSTGGVGDCVSLVLAPLVAACGGYVPMISGRGLGHTGGTLDKLEAIPGYRCNPDNDAFRACVRQTGLAIVGAGPTLAPADRRLYAVRDVTATVESTPLIVASILSKKLAAGLQALVLDVKCGNGAGCAEHQAARELAGALLRTARDCGLAAKALITDMDQPLADAAGNALEVYAALRVLRGDDRGSRLRELAFSLAEELLLAGALARGREPARARLEAALASGAAAERFARMLAHLGAPVDFVEHAERYLPVAAVVRPVFAEQAGVLRRIDTRALGLAVLALGGGRQYPDQAIDPAVGLNGIAALGQRIDASRPLAVIHARHEADWRAAAEVVRAACDLGPEPAPQSPLIHDRLDASTPWSQRSPG